VGTRWALALGLLSCLTDVARGQSPRAANPERPTFATHAYAVAPGYAELEQGLRVENSDAGDATAWDYNLKIGVIRQVQFAFFGTGFVHTRAGGGVGDVGVTLKLSTSVSPRATLALASSVTFPTGDAAAGRGAGRTQGGVLAVASVDAPGRLHVDVNFGPVELGAGASPLRWFHSVGAGVALGRYGLTTELYGFTAGAGESAEWGALGAVTVRPAEWIVVDLGGSVGVWRATPHLVFVGVTTNLGAVFK
jgi:hypothetical protein